MCCKVAVIKLTLAVLPSLWLPREYVRFGWYQKRWGLSNAACEIYARSCAYRTTKVYITVVSTLHLHTPCNPAQIIVWWFLHVGFLLSHVAGEMLSLYYHLFPWHWNRTNVWLGAFSVKDCGYEMAFLELFMGLRILSCWPSHSIVRPSETCCYWQAFIDWICSLSIFLIMLPQLNIKLTVLFQPNPQTPSNNTGNEWGCFPSPRGSALCLKSNHCLYEGMLILGCFAKCQWVVIYLEKSHSDFAFSNTWVKVLHLNLISVCSHPNPPTKLTPSPLNTLLALFFGCFRGLPSVLELNRYLVHLSPKQSLCCLRKSSKHLKYKYLWPGCFLVHVNLRVMTQCGDSRLCSPWRRLSFAHSLDMCLNH